MPRESIRICWEAVPEGPHEGPHALGAASAVPAAHYVRMRQKWVLRAPREAVEVAQQAAHDVRGVEVAEA